MGLLAERALELNHDRGGVGQTMRILCRHIESGERAWPVRLSGGRDIPLMVVCFQAQAHMIPLGPQDPDRCAQHRSRLREPAQKGVAGTKEGLFLPDPLPDPSTAL